MTDPAPVQTHIRKITIGTPVKKVTGAQAQALGDLTNVDATTNLADGAVLRFDITQNKFILTNVPPLLTIGGGTF